MILHRAQYKLISVFFHFRKGELAQFCRKLLIYILSFGYYLPSSKSWDGNLLPPLVVVCPSQEEVGSLSFCQSAKENGRRRSHCDVVWRCSVLTFARACLVLLPPPPRLKGEEEEKWGSFHSISRELFLGLCCVFQSGHTYSTVEHQLLTSYFFWRKKRKNKNPIKFDKAFKFLLCIWPRFFLLKGMYLSICSIFYLTCVHSDQYL